MSDLIDKISDKDRQYVKKIKLPRWIKPTLATLTTKRFSDPNWIDERKLDGERCITYREQDSVRLMSRNQKLLNDHYPDLEASLAQLVPQQFIVDGEIVAFNGEVTSFSRLQQRMHIQDRKEAQKSAVDVYYYLFDLLYIDGFEITKLPLQRRKILLKRLFDYQDPLRYMIHRTEDGEAYFKKACQQGWEGIIAKDGTSSFAHGRSRTWLKFKCVHQQEFVIGGFTKPHGSRIGFGALLLGYYENKKLRYAGKVGTGFDQETLQRLHKKLQSIKRETTPFSAEDLPSSEVYWVTPKLVAEIGFEEWTKDSKLRQPRYLGLREDKPAQKVVKEEADE